MVSVIIPAAGQGKRMGLGFNKIFSELSTKPVLLQTLQAFSRCDFIDEFIIVVHSQEKEIIEKVLSKLPRMKPYKVVIGGSERQYSVYNGLMAVNPEADIVLVHDAARPLISENIIRNIVNEVVLSGSAVCAVPVKDTIAQIGDTGFIEKVPDRSKLWAIQTPQGFKKDLLIQAFEKAREDNFLGTDEASLVLRLPHSVKLIMGDYDNIKVTTPSDLFVAEMLFSHQTAHQVKAKMSSIIGDVINKMQK